MPPPSLADTPPPAADPRTLDPGSPPIAAPAGRSEEPDLAYGAFQRGFYLRWAQEMFGGAA